MKLIWSLLPLVCAVTPPLWDYEGWKRAHPDGAPKTRTSQSGRAELEPLLAPEGGGLEVRDRAGSDEGHGGAAERDRLAVGNGDHGAGEGAWLHLSPGDRGHGEQEEREGEEASYVHGWIISFFYEWSDGLEAFSIRRTPGAPPRIRTDFKSAVRTA